MLGWYTDILIGYLIRYIVRIVKLHRSDGWPLEKSSPSKRAGAGILHILGAPTRLRVRSDQPGKLLNWMGGATAIAAPI